ncbi:MAG: DUF6508 domain-containing protein [Tenuifilaceae bacterium]|nr:DUF6508 domain-containing protein [Tenuifilaceae bacterium]
MAVIEGDYKEVISKYTQKDWQPMLDLIPEVEKTREFGKIGGGGKDENGVLIMPYSIPSEIVCRFEEIVYDIPIVISFDWGSWSKDNSIIHSGNFDYDTIDIPTKCMVITTFARANRFVDGVLVDAFEKGQILKILRSIERQLS